MESAEPIVVELAGFKMEVLGWEYPDIHDGWDADWLIVSCTCQARSAHVSARGPFVTVHEIARFLSAMEAIHSMASRTEAVQCVEPQLGLQFALGTLGDVRFTVDLTPDNLLQSHRMSFDIDQSYLPAAIAQCRAILETYPVRGAP